MSFNARGIIVPVLLLFLLSPLSAQDKNKADQTKSETILSSVLNGLSFEGQWFLSYQNGEKKNKAFNAFNLKRGYVTLKKKFSDHVSARVTQDVSVDRDGDGMGDIEIRLKYGYLRYTFNDLGFFTKPFIEVGVVHRPWLDFEQSINRYRVQDKMFLESSGILSSADYGVTFVSLLGGKIDKEYQISVNKKYPGKYGSISFGIYNGGGYHAIEENQNKFFEGRLSLRPLPEIIPGLQLSYLAGIGKGNTADIPDYKFHTGFLSLENKYYVLTGTYYNGTGNEEGSDIDEFGKATDSEGYSFFGELKYGDYALFSRYDYFEQDKNLSNPYDSKRFIVGAGFLIVKGVRLIVDYSYVNYSLPEKPTDFIFEAAIEFKY